MIKLWYHGSLKKSNVLDPKQLEFGIFFSSNPDIAKVYADYRGYLYVLDPIIYNKLRIKKMDKKIEKMLEQDERSVIFRHLAEKYDGILANDIMEELAQTKDEKEKFYRYWNKIEQAWIVPVLIIFIPICLPYYKIGEK